MITLTEDDKKMIESWKDPDYHAKLNRRSAKEILQDMLKLAMFLKGYAAGFEQDSENYYLFGGYATRLFIDINDLDTKFDKLANKGE
jgi:hypothetical protein